MCGISGFFSTTSFDKQKGLSIVSEMNDALIHRGPDDFGIFEANNSSVFLAHRRLSILDLSESGKQPMKSYSSRYTIVFNGEIYNHLEIRKELDKNFKISWKGSSDTESILNAIDYLGLKKALQISVGMFAFALWDNKNKTLSLARDRAGEKPLYYGFQGNILLFASEIKAIKKHPYFLNEIDKNITDTFLKLGYIPTPWTAWKNIFKLKPGCFITFSASNIVSQDSKPEEFWSFEETIKNSQNNLFLGDSKQAIIKLEELLIDSITGQMLSDVPLGAFLSGGIDSSTIVGIMQLLSSEPIKTFSIGFNNKKYNEANHAKLVANHLKTDHTELYVNEKDTRDLIPSLTQMFDEPFGDSSSIPTYLVSKLAKKDVTVVLSGDGGDELFGGYSRYQNNKAEIISSVGKYIPKFFLKKLSYLINNIPNYDILKLNILIDRLSLSTELARCSNYKLFYEKIHSHWRSSPLIIPESNQKKYGISNSIIKNIPDSMHKMMAIDFKSYLLDDILTKVDRASMVNSLETRVPLLDHRLVEFAWQLPRSMKLKNGEPKWILKQLLYKYVPKPLIDRPKKGFSIPVYDWLSGPLREWTETLIDSKKIKEDGIFDEKIIEKSWSRFLRGYKRLTHPIWLILTYQ